MNGSKVYVFKTSPKTLQMDIRKILNTTDFLKLNPTKETLVKINANYDRDWPGCNTSRWFLDVLLKNLREKGFDDLKVIEGDLKLQPAIRTIKLIGIDKILAKYGVPFLSIETLPRNGEIPSILEDAQLISTPVLHTHTFAVISVAAKNLYGLLPVYREKYHNTLPQKLLELVGNIKVFTIVDGTVGLEGGSMRMGNPIKTDLLLAGWDPIAIDIVSAKIMGFSIEEVPHLKFIKETGRTPKFIVRGDFSCQNLPKFSFAYKAPFLSKIDLGIRNSALGVLFKYNSLFDKAANHVRRKYLSTYYYLRKDKVLEGDWREYENAQTN